VNKEGWEGFFAASFAEVMADVRVSDHQRAKLPELCKTLAQISKTLERVRNGYDDMAKAILEHLGDSWTWSWCWNLMKANAERARQEEIQTIRGYGLSHYLLGMKVPALRKLYAEYAPEGEKTFQIKSDANVQGGKSMALKEAITPAIIKLIPAEIQETLLKQWKLDDLRKLRERPVKIEAKEIAKRLAWRLHALTRAKFRHLELSSPEHLSACPYWRYVFSDLTSSNPHFALTPHHHKQWDGLVLKHDHPFWKTHFPPNSLGCSCRITAVMEPEPHDKTVPPDGWDSIDPKTDAMIGIDKGWDLDITKR